MKRFFKLFMAVAAVAGVTACTTDATEDLGVNLNGGQTTLTLSLDDTRTQLGEKADGVYALTWAENDAISVNGSVSNALAEDEAGATSATFTFENGFGSAPYFVAYPATSTNNQVVFAAEQTHKNNTSFGNNAAVMYGYATDLNGVKLNHLTGVLKIGVVSNNNETLKSVRISTVDRKPIAGTFSVDAEGKLTPVNTTDVITYTFSEGVDLTAEPTYIHVAVPAGVYGELYVTLEAETEKEEVVGVVTKAIAYSYKTVVTDSTKPVNAGTVREFSNNLTFEPANAETDYVIASYDDLKKFKTAVEGGDTRNAVLVNDIEVGDDWASIDAAAYAATFNGNGYAIKGLKAPLFNATAATIKGVHLKGVNITSAATEDLGALVNTYTGTSVTHCSAEGKIELSNATVVRASGLVGYIPHNASQPFTMTDCVNNCKIEITLNATASLDFGGCLARIGTDENYNTTTDGFTFVNNTNNAAITIKGTSTVDVCGAGVLGYAGFYRINVDNCDNNGAVTVDMTKVRQIRIAGIVGRVYNSSDHTNNVAMNFSNCSNTATISAKNTNETVDQNYTLIGGCFAQLENYYKGGVVSNCNNSGNVLLDTTDIAEYNKMVTLGGVVAFFYSSLTFTNCNNTAEKVEAKMNGASENLAIGGILGMARIRHRNTNTVVKFKNCINKADVTATVAKSGSRVHVGGVAGWMYGWSETSFKYVFEDVDNYGSVKATVNNNFDSKKVYLYLGGILGDDVHAQETGLPDSGMNCNVKGSNCQFTRCYNHAAKDGSKSLYVMANNVYQLYAGGLIGATQLNFTMNTCENNLPFLYEGTKVTGRNFYGGLVGKIVPKHAGKTTTIDGFTNNGAITVKPILEEEYSISGGIAYCDNGSYNLIFNLKNMTNNGNITVTTGKADGSQYDIKHTRIAGLYAMTQRGTSTSKAYTHTFENLKNFGDISVSKVKADNGSNGGTITVGGVLGLCYYTATASNLYSNCDINVTDCTSVGNTYLGVLVGGFQTDVKMGTGNSVGGSLNGVTLTEENYYQYVYQGGTAETCSGVTLLAPIVDTPAEE